LYSNLTPDFVVFFPPQVLSISVFQFLGDTVIEAEQPEGTNTSTS